MAGKDEEPEKTLGVWQKRGGEEVERKGEGEENPSLGWGEMTQPVSMRGGHWPVESRSQCELSPALTGRF